MSSDDARLAGSGGATDPATEQDLAPAERLALVEAEQARTTASLEPDARLIYGCWGLAWLLGFGALYLQYGLGAWILIASAAGALAGTPGVDLVMSIAGGGGFLLAAAFFVLRLLGPSGSAEAAT